MFAIGQVSKMTGLSVRTLRYYDEIGLLKPSDYTEGHHRLYTEDDVTVLMKIVFLKELGFPLKKIKEHLEGETDWEAFLKEQYERLEREKKRIEHLMNGIETTLIIINGYLFAHAYRKTGSVFAAAFVHGMVNLLIYLVSVPLIALSQS